MKLATVNQVLSRTNKAGVSGTNPATIESALEASSVIISSILGTWLGYRELVDYFNYVPSRWRTNEAFTLNLSQQFVDSEGGGVRLYNTGTVNTALTAISDEYLVDPSLYALDARKGVIEVFKGLNYGVSSIAVRFEAGFDTTEGAGDEEAYDERIPAWLNEAAISGAVFAHHEQSSSHSKKDAKDMSGPLYRFMYTQISNEIFRNPLGYSPTRTVEL